MDKNVERFLQIEKDNDLFNHSFFEKKIWPLLRLEVFRLIERDIMKSNLVPVSRRQVFLNDGRKYSDLHKEKYEEELINRAAGCDFLVINNKHRFVKYHDEIICPVTGLLKQIDTTHRYCFFTQVYNRGKYQNYDSFEDVNYNCIRREAELLFSPQELEDEVNFFIDLFSNCYGFKLSGSFRSDLQEHIFYVADMMSYSSFYRRLLLETRPKGVIVSSYYATIDSVILNEARRLGITGIEMQHGTIGNEHVAYNNISNLVNALGVPDYLLAYGQFDVEVPRNFVPQNHVIPIGNLFLNRMQREQYLRNDCDCRNKVVLIASFNIGNEKLVRFAKEIKDRKPFWDIIYRFHPEEKIEKYTRSSLEEAGVSCEDSLGSNIYDRINQADYIVGTKSTVLYEALCFNKPSFVLTTDPDKDNWREAEKRLPHFSTVDSFLSLTHAPDTDRLKKLSQYFYADNGEERLSEVLSLIARQEI